MSLTRKEWEDMWNSVERIQLVCVNPILNKREKKIILEETVRIKNLIQQVIGQME